MSIMMYIVIFVGITVLACCILACSERLLFIKCGKWICPECSRQYGIIDHSNMGRISIRDGSDSRGRLWVCCPYCQTNTKFYSSGEVIEVE